MSCITENTIVIKPSDEKQFLKEVKKFEFDYRLSNVKEVFNNKDMIIFVADCNGDLPWEMESDTIVPLIMETNYGDEDEDSYWTRKSGIGDVPETCAELLKDMVTPEEYEVIEDRIAYTF